MEYLTPEPPEQLPCPRCESTNTKFCYYNNYNFSQPRHFCKACRRYWTHGGTLRDIPFGGASPTPLLGSALPFMVDGKGGMSMCGSFTSLLNIQGPTRLLGLGEFDQMGYGIGRATWPFAGFGDGGVSGGTMGANTWQLDGCQGGFTM
ncbi:hypothetical protein Leryth_024256 [Lithospermum erythrorhizon]|nr:hypothetical protein Leryth_024256 [Lithospermum erythrorhizon]